MDYFVNCSYIFESLITEISKDVKDSTGQVKKY